jgi:hypothetical protein
MDDSMTPETRQRTASPSPLVAERHLSAVGAARHMSLPLLGVLARISLAVALREATEFQTGGRGQDTVGNAERRSSASRPEVAANVVDPSEKCVDHLSTTRYGPSRLAMVSECSMSVGDGS